MGYSPRPVRQPHLSFWRDKNVAEKAQARMPIAERTTPDLVLKRFAPEETYKTKVYNALKRAIIDMDIYSSPDPTWIDERQLSESLGVSRTPIREAVAMLEQQGFVKSMPRRGIMVLKKTKRDVVEMIQIWAALEGMAARLPARQRRRHRPAQVALQGIQ
jgi:DNA-binding GntR family transcriptional regulator